MPGTLEPTMSGTLKAMEHVFPSMVLFPFLVSTSTSSQSNIHHKERGKFSLHWALLECCKFLIIWSNIARNLGISRPAKNNHISGLDKVGHPLDVHKNPFSKWKDTYTKRWCFRIVPLRSQVKKASKHNLQ